MSASEAFVRRFHAARPGVTTAAFARGDAGDGRSTYAQLVACVPAGARVLDLGCGDGYLLAQLGHARAIGIDLSEAELAVARDRGVDVVQARAQALPLRAGAFDRVVSHLAFTLMDDAAVIARELARVIAPGGTFAAIVGGGPVGDATPSTDALTCWLAMLARARPSAIPRLGDPRARTAAGWRELFAPLGCGAIAFERLVVDLGGAFAEVWTTLSTIYEADGADVEAMRGELAAAFATHARVPCAMVVWLATATRR